MPKYLQEAKLSLG